MNEIGTFLIIVKPRKINKKIIFKALTLPR